MARRGSTRAYSWGKWKHRVRDEEDDGEHETGVEQECEVLEETERGSRALFG